MEERKKLKELLYSTITKMDAWHDVLAEICSITGAPKAMITLRDKLTAELFVTQDVNIELESPMLFGLTQREVESYIRDYYHLDPWTLIERKTHPYAPYTMSSFLPIEKLKKMPFWQWIETQNFNDSVVMELYSSRDSWVAINVFIDGYNDNVKTATLNLLSSIQHDLNFVWQQGLNIRASLAPPESLMYFLEQQEQAAILVDKYGKVIGKNNKSADLFTDNSVELSEKEQFIFIRDKNLLSEFRNKIASLSLAKFNTTQAPSFNMIISNHILKCVLLGKGQDIVGTDTALRLITIENVDDPIKQALIPIWQAPSLTQREQQLVEVLAKGGRVVDFMTLYNVAKSTSHAHWTNTKRKLKVRDRSEIYAHHQLYLQNQ